MGDAGNNAFRHVRFIITLRGVWERHAQASNGLCVFHDPDKASEGHRARRAGGITRSRPAAVLPSDTPDHPLGNPKQVSDLLADSVNRLRRGQLDPRVANAMGYLASVLLRALEQGPMEERLAYIEAILGKGGAGSELFEIRSTKYALPEQPSTPKEGE
jgi:hypothetical protein